jgi:hypothetical protein
MEQGAVLRSFGLRIALPLSAKLGYTAGEP